MIKTFMYVMTAPLYICHAEGHHHEALVLRSCGRLYLGLPGLKFMCTMQWTSCLERRQTADLECFMRAGQP